MPYRFRSQKGPIHEMPLKAGLRPEPAKIAGSGYSECEMPTFEAEKAAYG